MGYNVGKPKQKKVSEEQEEQEALVQDQVLVQEQVLLDWSAEVERSESLKNGVNVGKSATATAELDTRIIVIPEVNEKKSEPLDVIQISERVVEVSDKFVVQEDAEDLTDTEELKEEEEEDEQEKVALTLFPYMQVSPFVLI